MRRDCCHRCSCHLATTWVYNNLQHVAAATAHTYSPVNNETDTSWQTQSVCVSVMWQVLDCDCGCCDCCCHMSALIKHKITLGCRCSRSSTSTYAPCHLNVAKMKCVSVCVWLCLHDISKLLVQLLISLPYFNNNEKPQSILLLTSMANISSVFCLRVNWNSLLFPNTNAYKTLIYKFTFNYLKYTRNQA